MHSKVKFVKYTGYVGSLLADHIHIMTHFQPESLKNQTYGITPLWRVTHKAQS